MKKIKTETKSTEKTDEEHAASKMLVITQTQHREMHDTGATAAAASTQRAKRKQRHNCALRGQSRFFFSLSHLVKMLVTAVAPLFGGQLDPLVRLVVPVTRPPVGE